MKTTATKIVFILSILIIPLVVRDEYLYHVFSIYYLYVIMAIGLSLVVAYAGLLNLGFVAFFAVGAYSYAILNTHFHLPFILAIPLAALLAGLFAMIIGVPTLRVRGDYLALVTLAFGEMVRLILINWSAVTNGPKGIFAIDPMNLPFISLEEPGRYYYFIAILLTICVLMQKKLTASPLAHIWEALRDDETAARVNGINPQVYYLAAFAIGAAFAGIAGVIFASLQQFVSPESFMIDESILVLSIVVLSGGKSVTRIFIATALFYLAPEILRGLKEYRLLVFGCFLVFFIIFEERLNRLFSARSNSRPPVINAVPLRPNKKIERILKISNLKKDFNGIKALDGVTFDMNLSSSIVGIIGPNGAGKTTLFNCMSALERVTSGGIAFGGLKNIERLGPHKVSRYGIGRTFQKVRLFKSMTVLENVLIGCYCQESIPFFSSLVGTRGYKRFIERCHAKAAGILETLGIPDNIHDMAATLPLGLQRKVELARTLAIEPKLLLLDEVASGLNDSEKKDFANILKRLSSELGIEMLIVEHDMAFILDLAGYIVVLDSGTVIAEGQPEEISHNKRVIEAYLGSAYAENH